MDNQSDLIRKIYLEGLRRDQVADQFGITTKVLRVIEREYLKKILAKHFEGKSSEESSLVHVSGEVKQKRGSDPFHLPREMNLS